MLLLLLAQCCWLQGASLGAGAASPAAGAGAAQCPRLGRAVRRAAGDERVPDQRPVQRAGRAGARAIGRTAQHPDRARAAEVSGARGERRRRAGGQGCADPPARALRFPGCAYACACASTVCLLACMAARPPVCLAPPLVCRAVPCRAQRRHVRRRTRPVLVSLRMLPARSPARADDAHLAVRPRCRRGVRHYRGSRRARQGRCRFAWSARWRAARVNWAQD